MPDPKCSQGVRRGALLAACVIVGIAMMLTSHAAAAQAKACPDTAAGLKLAPGFCATIFADKIGHARHLAVAPDGVLYVNTWSGRYYGNDRPPEGGFLVALQDTKRTGHADVKERFGPTTKGGTGIAIYKDHLYYEVADRIERLALRSGTIAPQGEPEVIVSGLPLGGDHPMHPFAIDADGMMYVDVASASNACQEKNRILKSPGINPCVELETRAGIWRYDANKTGQKYSPSDRYATGIRNADGIAVDGSGHEVYSTQHGRDQLSQNWPSLYKPVEGAILPAEELMHIQRGGDYGWPECYYDGVQRKLVLAPEYGGDGGRKVGVCAQKIAPVAAFPAHWAPDDLLIYSAREFPARYHNGAFIAFHGSWNRAPFPQGGYNVVFQPLANGNASGKCEIFADGFAGETKDPEGAAHRPTGLAVGPDGALFVSDDAHGRVYRIAYTGSGGDAAGTPCPEATDAGPMSAGGGVPPEGTYPNAAAAANLPVPKGSTRASVVLGARIFAGQEGGATCTSCHGADGKGTPLGPDLTDQKWLWSDGGLAGIRKTINEGVPNPKEYRSPMPPMGGAQLTADQVSAVAAYVWALSHHDSH
ncbi:MAG TPA: c-type cytochrome [Steroidobacteraceae bacterium]|nr:c-type cytochrome [Steroidobacteraceae bacterium]